jgi:hypothetical protein
MRFLASLLVMMFLGVGCGPMDEPIGEDAERARLDGKADSSVEATILDFEWDGEVVAEGYSSYVGAESYIRDQLLFTIGHLNGNRSVGRLDKLTITNVRTEATTGGTRIRYKTRMPVAWGSKTNLPSSYVLTLPRVVGYDAIKSFTAKYKSTCVDSAAHDVTDGSIWYYYRPKAYRCTLDPKDVVTATARVGVSAVNTTGKYPEYNKVWEDGVLRVVAIFGKYEDGATTSSDAGIAAYNTFVSSIKSELRAGGLTTTPATVPTSPGVGTPDIEFRAELSGGRKVVVNTLLVDNVSTASSTFYARYESLSTRADIIVYNGHAGLGQNVRALARKGRWTRGQYVIVFMNGCDTYAYVDGSLAETRARINTDDPSGTKYMDFVVNGMPAYFHSDSAASMAMIRGLLSRERPQTYEQIFRNIDSSQVVLVTGEQDNVFKPSSGGTTGWQGISDTATVARNERKTWSTTELPAGRYLFEMSGTGDADLYVRKGSAPTTASYDCRPYKSDSNEQCLVTLTAPARLYAMVLGYGASSQVRLTGRAQ